MYFSTVKTYGNVVSRGYFLHIIGLKRKEINLYLSSLEKLQLLPTEKRDLMFIIGLWYTKNNRFSEALYYFEHAFQNFHETFPYKKEFESVVAAYIECNQIEKAREVLKYFLKRKTFDKRFIRLEKKYCNLL
ncbi:hypothetical protein ACQKP0_12120 [Heyndrickxia sp. NPDC080065]|uniref:hypothetical protein n=1 Tax=Heyndrickxia sp. NPDC080065 TaxID=3390568 RepID=UPI003D04575B